MRASIGHVEEIDGWTTSDHPYPNVAPRNQKVSVDIDLKLVLICWLKWFKILNTGLALTLTTICMTLNKQTQLFSASVFSYETWQYLPGMVVEKIKTCLEHSSQWMSTSLIIDVDTHTHTHIPELWISSWFISYFASPSFKPSSSPRTIAFCVGVLQC